MISVDEEHNYEPDLDAITDDIVKQSKMLFLNYPSNPTGTLASDAFLEKDCDLIVLAANENTINSNNHKKVKGKVILELANGPINFDSPDFQEMKDKIVIPDILANSGGVVGSYLEWKNNLENTNSTKIQNLEYLDKQITKVFNKVIKTAESLNINLRKASYVEALKNLP